MGGGAGVRAVCNGVDKLGVGAVGRVKMGVGRGGQKIWHGAVFGCFK